MTKIKGIANGAVSCLDSVIDNAIGIEMHNRNTEGYKTDDLLNNVYVLASAFVDGGSIIPVKLEVKEFSDKENTLHVAIALESIKKDEIVKQEVAKDGVARQYSPSSNISIADYFRKINPSDESFYKYIPKKFLKENNSGNVQYSMKNIDEELAAEERNTRMKNRKTVEKPRFFVYWWKQGGSNPRPHGCEPCALTN